MCFPVACLLPSVEKVARLAPCGQQVRGRFKRQGSASSHPTSHFQVAHISSLSASNGKLVAKLAESNNEQWWRVRLWWFQRIAPPASRIQGFAPASAFVSVGPLRHGTENVALSEPSASKQRPGQGSLESVAIQPAPCHNHGFNRTRGKILAGFAGLAQWPRRLTQTL